MSDWQARIEMLRFLERVQLQQLALTGRWIEHAEQRATKASTEDAPDPQWMLDGGAPVSRTVHRDPGCFALRSPRGAPARSISREEAVAAITQGGATACEVCRPDTALGVLE